MKQPGPQSMDSAVPGTGPRPAVALAHGYLTRRNAKTTHGMLRGPSRFRLTAVVDPEHAGSDAGQVVFGEANGIPVVADIPAACALAEVARVCVIGVATPGGTLPRALRGDILKAADAGMTLVNGLHHLLAEDAEIARHVAHGGGRIVDIRAPRPTRDLRFWTGAVHDIRAQRIAVLGTDCALGKRTTTMLLADACRRQGLRTQVLYTGQTGWLQGLEHGFIFDATPNDFVCGELERALLEAAADGDPDLILMEGQSGLRNPSGPCGPEFILSGAAHGVILQHAPGRLFYEGLEERGLALRPVLEDVQLVKLYGSRVLALCLSQEGLDRDQAEAARRQVAAATGLTTLLPLVDGLDSLAQSLARQLRESEAAGAP